MTEETRRILKVFGIAVTNFEERQRQIAEGLSAGAQDPAKAGEALRDACKELLELQERWMETTHLVFDAQKRLLQDVLKTA